VLTGRAYGFVNAANEIGKILGLCCLDLVVDFSKVLSDQASVLEILPTFLFPAACGLVIGVCLDTA
jgi:sugar phosphate permease